MPITARSPGRVRLRRMAEDLGPSLLEVLAPAGSLDTEIAGVTILAAGDELAIGSGELVLGVGLATETEICEVIARLSVSKAAALMIKVPAEVSEKIRATAQTHGVPVLGLARDASWFHVAVLLHAMLERWLMIDGELHDSNPVGDLFAFANAVSALMDAPVTVEDPASRVLAFSGRQAEADRERIQAVLERRVPPQARQQLEEMGVFRELHRSREPILVPGFDATMVPRVAVAIRAGEEILGSLWVATKEPLSTERLQALADAAELAALHILRQRSAHDLGRRLSAELLRTVLEDGDGASDAAARLGLKPGPLCVLACQPLGTTGATFEADSQRLAISLDLHLTAIHPHSAVAVIGAMVYAVVSISASKTPGHGVSRIQATAADFVARMGERAPTVIGIGGPAPSRQGVGRSRSEAERTVRVLRDVGRAAVANFDDVYLETVLDQLGDLLDDEQDRRSGPVARLHAYDAENGTDLTDSLSIYLDAFGDVAAAAAAMKVHPNTLRYRLKRIQEIGQVNLDDPRSRLAVLVQLTTPRGRAD